MSTYDTGAVLYVYLNNAPLPKKTGDHRHHCPTCYTDAPCVHTCTICPDLSDDANDRGSPVDCDPCAALTRVNECI